MDSSRLQSIRTRFSSQNIRTTFRRSSSSSSSTSSSTASSPASFHSATAYVPAAITNTTATNPTGMMPVQPQRDSFASCSSSSMLSPVDTINAVLFRQPSIADLEAEKRSSGVELTLLEPRPIVYWGGVEERIMGFH